MDDLDRPTTSQPRRPRGAGRVQGLAVAMVALGLGLALAACGDDGGGAAAPAGCRAAEDGAVTLVAKDVAWDTDCLSLPADTAVTITIDNQDDKVNHNLHVLGLPDGSPKTNLEEGPVTQELQVSAPAGRYVYVCDVHPNMKGDLQVG
jgi:plastocyanin